MFIDYEPHEEFIFSPFDEENDINIPSSDRACWLLYPKLRHLYLKPNLCQWQGLDYGLSGIYPQEYPVFEKPVSNLWGNGAGSRKIEGRSDYNHKPGYFWMEHLTGQNIAVDCIIRKGNVIWSQPAERYLDGDHLTDYWELIPSSAKITHLVQQFVSNYIPKFTGFFNIKFIGDYAVGCTFHMTGRFIDMYGRSFLNSMSNFARTAQWEQYHVSVDKFSVPIYTKGWYDEDLIRDIIESDDGVCTIGSEVESPLGGEFIGYFNGIYLDGLKESRDKVINAINSSTANNVVHIDDYR